MEHRIGGTKAFNCQQCGNVYYAPAGSSVGTCSFCSGALATLQGLHSPTPPAGADGAGGRDADIRGLLINAEALAVSPSRDGSLLLLVKYLAEKVMFTRDSADAAWRLSDRYYARALEAEALTREQAQALAAARTRSSSARAALEAIRTAMLEADRLAGEWMQTRSDKALTVWQQALAEAHRLALATPAPITYEGESALLNPEAMNVDEPYPYRLDGDWHIAVKRADGTLDVFALATPAPAGGITLTLTEAERRDVIAAFTCYLSPSETGWQPFPLSAKRIEALRARLRQGAGTEGEGDASA
jgi:hypothetical protein